jgi:hypothetical protein
MFLVARLPSGERWQLSFGNGATISDLIKRVAEFLSIREEQICCLVDGWVIFPFVNLTQLPMVEIQFLPDVAAKVPPPRVRGIVAKVNGAQLSMIVDTGATTSIIYSAQALACGIEWMIDTRRCVRYDFTGADGVLFKTIGVIHALEISFGGLTTHLRVAVVDGDITAGLLGMDWLRANEAIIDVVNDCMYVGTLCISFRDL